MYTSFFGLSDIPFSIAPNPQFLYKSERHKEALAHLTYGLGDTGGFVLLTGEVGTGKTTISRCVLEQLDIETNQVAFILNPTLSSQELLATVCDELKIRYKKTGATLRYLTDKILGKLVKNHQADINTILIIDEAQHLEPEVLEQLRLLTNLETDTKKLLQVILIGQPELQVLLKRRDLRQLAQRITARYHLLPLTKPEIEAYVKHRLSVADCHRDLFNKKAIKALHVVSQGIPRLINLLCERSLVLAYGKNNSVIDAKTVYEAAEQVLGEDLIPKPIWQHRSVKMALASTVLIGGLLIGYFLGNSNSLQLEEVISNETVVVKNSVKEAIKTADHDIEKSNNKLNNKAQNNIPLSTQSTPDSSPKLLVNNDNVAAIAEVEDGQKTISHTAENNDLIASLDKSDESVESISSGDDRSDSIEFDISNVEGVSEDLLARVQSAIEETNEENVDESHNVESSEYEVRSLADMPVSIQNAIPNLQFEMHIYASDGEGWVRVNGRDRYEGDAIANGLVLSKILPQKVVLSYRGDQFSLPALSNW